MKCFFLIAMFFAFMSVAMQVDALQMGTPNKHVSKRYHSNAHAAHAGGRYVTVKTPAVSR